MKGTNLRRNQTEGFEQTWAERSSYIEFDAVVATDGNQGWTATTLSGGSRDESCPIVVHDGLMNQESVEGARPRSLIGLP